MATSMELAFRKAIKTAAYKVCGETVTYSSVTDGESEIETKVESGFASFAEALEAQTSHREVACRVKKSNVAHPRRGDTITDADSNVFNVEDVESLNSTEWRLAVRVCSDG